MAREQAEARLNGSAAKAPAADLDPRVRAAGSERRSGHVEAGLPVPDGVPPPAVLERRVDTDLGNDRGLNRHVGQRLRLFEVALPGGGEWLRPRVDDLAAVAAGDGCDQ